MDAKKKSGVRKQERQRVINQVADVLQFRAVEIYHQAQDTALGWFSSCENGPHDFAGAKRKVDDLMLRHGTIREAVELLGKLEA